MEKATAKNVKIHLPEDFITADKFAENAEVTGSLNRDDGILNVYFQVGSADVCTGIPDGWMGLDIGPKTRLMFQEPIDRAKVIVWNGYDNVINPEMLTLRYLIFQPRWCVRI